MKITPAQISAARSGDTDAISHVLAECESWITLKARQFASTNGVVDHHRAEDMAQEGRLAVLVALPNFSGEPVGGALVDYLTQHIRGAMHAVRYSETGVHPKTAKLFERAVRMAYGNVHRAERVLTDAKAMGSPDYARKPAEAHAARLAYQGTRSLDAPVPGAVDGIAMDGAEGGTLGDFLAASEAIPEDLRDASDCNAEDRKARVAAVRSTLSMLGETQRKAVASIVGINGPQFDKSEARELGEWIFGERTDRTYNQARQAKSKGLTRFTALYVENHVTSDPNGWLIVAAQRRKDGLV